MIDWIFDLLAKLWDGFWNVIGKLIGSLILAALICMSFTIVAKLTTDEYEVETAIFTGAFVAIVKLIIEELVAPLFYQHGKLERERRKRLADELFKGQRRF